jgi:hypothetical protein
LSLKGGGSNERLHVRFGFYKDDIAIDDVISIERVEKPRFLRGEVWHPMGFGAGLFWTFYVGVVEDGTDHKRVAKIVYEKLRQDLGDEEVKGAIEKAQEDLRRLAGTGASPGKTPSYI